jgi:site-specific DNA-methyltransferase (adenine-specific)
MNPYYADDSVTLYHGDCREVTAWLDADVLVTDPPYGRDYRGNSDGWTNSSGGGGHRSTGQARSIANDKDTTARDEALVLWGDRPAIVFGDPLIAKPTGTRQALVYAKPMDAGIKGAHAGYRRDVEMVYLVGSWPVAIGGRSSILRTNALVAGPRGLSVRYEHPHAKPVDLLADLISKTVGVVADPFAGSGSTLVAAKQLGRKAIGVELEERYCEIIAKRLAQGVLDFGSAS